MAENPVKGKAFKLPQKFLDDLPLLGDVVLEDRIRELCKKVEQLVTGLGISDVCTGFVTDGDLARSWEDCIAGGHRETKSASHSQVVPIAVPDTTHRPHLNSGLVH